MDKFFTYLICCLLIGFGQCVKETNASKTKIDKNETKKSLIILGIIFIVSMILLIYIYMMFPDLSESEKKYLKIPWNIEDAKNLGLVLNQYKEKHHFVVMLGTILAYIFLQTFAIPGSLFLSILSGFLFNFPTALILVCCCSALGATLCYLLSQLVGRRLVKHFFPERAAKWSGEVDKHRDNLLSYMLFLRMTPFLPNWFINLTAPVIGVPLIPFAFGTFLGVAPPSVIAIQAGKTLHNMTSSNEAFSYTSMLVLFVLAILSLAPVIYKKLSKKKVE